MKYKSCEQESNEDLSREMLTAVSSVTDSEVLSSICQ